MNARGDLVDDDPLGEIALGLEHEQLHREDADIAERLADAAGRLDRL